MTSFYSYFLESVRQWPQNTAVEMQWSASTQPASGEAVEGYSYAELRKMAESVGRWLQENRIARGSRCAILASNGPRWVAAYLGAVAAGDIAVPLDTAFLAEQVSTLLRDSGSSLLFTDAKHLAVAQRAVEALDIKLVVLDGNAEESRALPHLDEMFAAGADGFTPGEVKGEDVAVILYTSGTTSDPKGVMLTQDNLAAEIEAVFAFLQVGPTDAVLGVLPLFHALAQMANLLLPLSKGARVVYLESLNTTELLRGLRERQITLFCCVPQFFYLIHERVMKEVKERGAAARVLFGALLGISEAGRVLGLNPGKLFFRRVHQTLGTSMRYLITGGSRFDTEIGRSLEAMGFEILEAYGLTECSGGATCTSPQHNVIGSVGQPLPGVEVAILDGRAEEDSAGQRVGEIAIRGGIVMKGYYNRPEATAEVIRDGWLHTGDLGYLDEEGNLFVTGREKEVIVLSSGKNIYPEEIEAHYLKSPFIKELCVLGLESRAGEPQSERLHAVVVPNLDALRQHKIVNTREVIRYDIENLSAQMPSTKRILSYDIWQEELPRTTTRKLKRFEIQKRVAEKHAAGKEMGDEAIQARASSEEETRWLEEPEVARALQVIRKAAKDKAEVHPQDNLELDLGLDSMERVELLVELERELGAKVNESLASQVYTVRELVEAVRAGMGAEGGKGRTVKAASWARVLAEDPTDPEVLAVAKPRPIMAIVWFVAIRLLNLLARVGFHLKVTGLEKLPARGPCILSPNHQSYLDPPVFVSALPWRLFKDLFFVGTSDLFGSGVGRAIARTMNLIPVDPDSNLVPAMRAGAYGLRQGKILVLYPEGERSIDGAPKTFRKGAAILAAHVGVPIYPVALAGFHEAWPRGKRFQRTFPLRIAIGDPVLPPEKLENPDETYGRLTAELRKRVVEMWTKLHAEVAGEKTSAAAAD